MTERAKQRGLRSLLVVVAVGALAGAFLLAQRPPGGPVDPVWDRSACARCRMLISEPRFAAQLHTERGDVLHFDDPGCLLVWEHEHDDVTRAAWFHHLDEERWVEREAAVFVPAEPTPMEYGFGARERPAPGLAWQQALREALARDAARGPVAAGPPSHGDPDASRP